MAHSEGWERDFITKGFSLATVAFLRDISEVVQPGVISLDVTELEALQHEFRILKNRLDAIESAMRVITSTTAVDYTTRWNEVIICIAAVEITLNTVPNHNEHVTIKNNSTGIVTVTGAIDGGTFYKMLATDESKTFRYSSEDSEWYIE